MRDQVEAARFGIGSQRRIFRMPAGWTLPTVLTQARRPHSNDVATVVHTR
jgi:hypothetical protein